MQQSPRGLRSVSIRCRTVLALLESGKSANRKISNGVEDNRSVHRSAHLEALCVRVTSVRQDQVDDEALLQCAEEENRISPLHLEAAATMNMPISPTMMPQC